MTRPVAQLERCMMVLLLLRHLLHVMQRRVMNRSTSRMNRFRTIHPYSLIGRRVRRRRIILRNAGILHKVARWRKPSRNLPWTVRRRYRYLGKINPLQQVLVVQPRQRSQFFVIRSNPVYNHPIGSQRSRRGPNCMVLVMGQLMAGAATAAGDDQVVADGVAVAGATASVKDFVIGRVHLFRGQQDDVADAVHAFRGGYIILAQVSLLEHDQLGRLLVLLLLWRHHRRLTCRRGSVAMDGCHVGNTVSTTAV